MFCRKCGAAVSGNFCCVCGERVRSALEIFRLDERRKKTAFKKSVKADISGTLIHLADACWAAADRKCELHRAVTGSGKVQPDAYDRLQKTADLARRLYAVLLEELMDELNEI